MIKFRTIFTTTVDWEIAFSGPPDSKIFPGDEGEGGVGGGGISPRKGSYQSRLPYLSRFREEFRRGGSGNK